MFPAASKARMVTWFDPVRSGIDADHAVVPAAVPEDPVFVDQVTLVTPTLSEAVPENAREADVVDTELPPGDVMVRVGAVVSLPPEGGAGEGDGEGEGEGDGAGAVGSGAGAGVGGAAVAGAYIVRIAA